MNPGPMKPDPMNPGPMDAIHRWDQALGLSQFNNAIPLIITSVTVGASIVNRTFMKILGHLIGAIFAGAIAGWLTNRFVTAFLGYTIVYVFMCFKNGMPDTGIIVGMVLGFASLLFINMFVSTSVSGGGAPYFGTLILSGLCGLIGVYMVQSFPNGNAYLYDFKGCSCDDCASNNIGNSGDGGGGGGSDGTHTTLLLKRKQ
jgi:hypothetical protein